MSPVFDSPLNYVPLIGLAIHLKMCGFAFTYVQIEREYVCTIFHSLRINVSALSMPV